jgi:Heme exporter protein D (CcmD)
MRFAEYVITGWALTAVVIGGYWLWIVLRTKRAEQSLPDGEVE